MKIFNTFLQRNLLNIDYKRLILFRVRNKLNYILKTGKKKAQTGSLGLSLRHKGLYKNLAVTYFRMGTPTLSSAMTRFTSEFGMGSGGSMSLWPPGKTVESKNKLSSLFVSKRGEVNQKDALFWRCSLLGCKCSVYFYAFVSPLILFLFLSWVLRSGFLCSL